MESTHDRDSSLQNIKDAITSFQKMRETEPAVQTYLKTPNFERKIKRITKDYEETEKMKIMKRENEGITKWVFKTEMKVVNPPVTYSLKEAFKKDTTLSKLKMFTKASQANLKKTLDTFEDKIRTVEHLLYKTQRAKKENNALKKQILVLDAKRNRILYMINKRQTINEEIDAFHAETEQIRDLITGIYKQSQIIRKDICSFKEAGQMVTRTSRQIEKEIVSLIPLVDLRKKELKELSMTKMPNHRQIINCMFSIGILNQQIYILELEKLFKKNMTAEEARIKKPEKNANKKEFHDRNISQKINECQMNRQITVDCRSTDILVFKVLTVIYMHFRSLLLNNKLTLMKKTSYFSEEFKQIYFYELFDAYLSNLIQRNKGNQIKQDQIHERNELTRNKTTYSVKVAVITNEISLNYLRWILCSFQEKDSHFLINFDQTTVEIHLFSFQEIDRKQRQCVDPLQQIGSKAFLRIVFHNFEEELL